MLANEVFAVCTKGKSMLEVCRMLATDSLGTSVSCLDKIGTLTDWDEQQLDDVIDNILLSRCSVT
jgi:hypothetical protein